MPKIDKVKLRKLRELLFEHKLKKENKPLSQWEFLKYFKDITRLMSDSKIKSEIDIRKLRDSLSDKLKAIKLKKGEEGEQGIRGKDGKSIKGDKGEKGEKGKSIRGTDGLDGIDGDNGKDADETRVAVIASERAIEGLKPLIPTDISQQVANKFKTLLEIIKNLKRKLKKLEQRPTGRVGGARKVVYLKTENLSSQVDGSTKIFTMPKDCVDVVAVFGTQYPLNFNKDTDFTFEGGKLTLTDEVEAPKSGQTLFALINCLFYG